MLHPTAQSFTIRGPGPAPLDQSGTQSGTAARDGGSESMNQAQIGLLIVTPMIVGMAVLLYRQGVMTKAGAAVASLAAVAAAAAMFFTQ